MNFGVLKNFLVLDLSRFLPGPYCSMILADHGARVITIENNFIESDIYGNPESINRNKEHMKLNLKTRHGKDILLKLVKKADVFIEGFRPGVCKRLEIDYNSLKKINPGIVYASLTGYGQTGPLKDNAAHDLNCSGQGGALSLMGFNDSGPFIPGIQLADISGGLNTAIGILLALLSREKTGNGQYIDISMTDSVTALLPIAFSHYLDYGENFVCGNHNLSHKWAWYNIYKTKDNKFLTFAPMEKKLWTKFCKNLNLHDYIDLQFDIDNCDKIKEHLMKIFITKNLNEWMKLLRQWDVCGGEIMNIEDILESENSLKREMIVRIEGYERPLIGIPIKLSDNPGSIRTSPSSFGQHTESILKEIGYSSFEINSFKEQGVV